MATTTYPDKQAREASVALCVEHGLDGYMIVSNTWDESSYEVFLDPLNRLAGRERRLWPHGFPIEKFIDIRGGVGV